MDKSTVIRTIRNQAVYGETEKDNPNKKLYLSTTLQTALAAAQDLGGKRGEHSTIQCVDLFRAVILGKEIYELLDIQDDSI